MDEQLRNSISVLPLLNGRCIYIYVVRKDLSLRCELGGFCTQLLWAWWSLKKLVCPVITGTTWISSWGQ